MARKREASLKMKLSGALVKALEHDGDGDRTRVWDKSLNGFGLVIYSSGKKRFFVTYRTAQGRQRRMNLGDPAVKSVEEARKEARSILGRVDDGEDPMATREALRASMTFAEFWELYAEDAQTRWKPSTSAEHQRLWKKIVSPALGSMPLNTIKAADISTWHRRLKDTPIQANRSLRLVRAMFNKAIEWELIPPPSPAARVKLNPEKARERFLSPEEFQIIFQAIELEEAEGGKASVDRPGDAAELARIERELKSKGKEIKRRKDGSIDRRYIPESGPRGITPHAAALFRMLILTGARLGEIMKAKWDWVLWNDKILALPDSKTGARRIPLSAPAIEELKRLEQYRTRGNVYIIEGNRDGAHLVNPEKPWSRVRKTAGEILNERRGKAGLDPLKVNPFADLRIHDLRHSFASVAVSAGLALPIIGKALGHSQGRTTERYAHLAADPVLAAADLVGATILEAVSKPLAVVEEIAKE